MSRVLMIVAGGDKIY